MRLWLQQSWHPPILANLSHKKGEKQFHQFHFANLFGYQTLTGETAISLQFHCLRVMKIFWPPLVMIIFATNSHRSYPNSWSFSEWLGSNHSEIRYLLPTLPLPKGGVEGRSWSETEVKLQFHSQAKDSQQLAESETGETEIRSL